MDEQTPGTRLQPESTPAPWEWEMLPKAQVPGYAYGIRRTTGTQPDKATDEIPWPVALVVKEADARLMAAAPQMLAQLQLAVRYLEHPDVQAMPFALSAECVASRVREAIEAASS